MSRLSKAERLRPDLLVHGVEDIDLDWLAAHGVRGILLDLDNTLTAWRSHDVPEAKRRWVERAKKRFAVGILSNTMFGRRLRRLEEMLGVPGVGCWGPGRKPGTGGLMRALGLIGVKPGEAVMVGDQIFTDIKAGKRAGTLTVLVEPIDPAHELFSTRITRWLEAGLRRQWRSEAAGETASEEGRQEA